MPNETEAFLRDVFYKLLQTARYGYTIGTWSVLWKIILVLWDNLEIRLPEKLQKLVDRYKKR